MNTRVLNRPAGGRTNFIITGIRLLLALACLGAIVVGVRASAAAHAFAGGQFLAALTAFVGFALTFVPGFMARRKMMVMPPAFQAMFAVFVWLAMFFGEMLHFYDRFFWWDSMLHLASGLLFAYAGYLLFVSQNPGADVRRQLNPASVLLFALCFSMACGVVWEIFEFAGDCLLGMNMQRWVNSYTPQQWAALQNVSNASNPGLVDTMKDIICDTAGSLLSIAVILPLVRRNNRTVKLDVLEQESLAA